MANMLDFNKFKQPTLPIVLCDGDQTKLTVTAPSEELIEKLEANKDDISKAFKNKDLSIFEQLYSLTAELISCNEEGITVTGEELRKKYGVNYAMLFTFYHAYEEFIDDIKSAKN